MSNELAETLSLIAGTVLALAFQIVPALKNWLDSKGPAAKQGVMIGILLVVSLALVGLSCSGWLAMLLPGVSLTCDAIGIATIIRAFILAVLANTGTYFGTRHIFEKKGAA